jgi:NapC/NirT cytochrome c family protein
MTAGTGIRGQLRPLVYLGRNPVTLAGVALTTSAALTLITFWVAEVLRDQPTHPYAGLLLYLILPGIFLLGLILMPLGILWRRRQLKKANALPVEYPVVDLRALEVQRGLVVIGSLTVMNVAILGTASYKGVEYMDSSRFCGLTCHKVMAPEYSAFVNSPHSRVGCAQCHIGPGANWFVRSKLSGVRQVFAVALETYSRPIPSPVRQLRPARETCEQCHWPERFVGNRVRVTRHYADDEANTATITILVLKIGGGVAGHGAGIHGRHVGEHVQITYDAADSKRQVIPRVSVAHPDGSQDEYVSSEPPPSPAPQGGERRVMDCMDCHNRPTHTFEMPERAMDERLAGGQIDPKIPYIKKKGVEVLRTEYPDSDTALRQIAENLGTYYRTSYPAVYTQQRTSVDAAIGEVQAIYRRNVFPNMKVTWGTYPNNLGHEDFIGCFRCHDDSHKRKDGATITQDCTACHAILAQDEKEPKILADFGLK